MEIRERIFRRELHEKITTAPEAAGLVRDGMHIGTSGFTPSGYPKVVPLALAQRVRSGERLHVTLGTGASVGVELEESWAEERITTRRYPYQTGK